MSRKIIITESDRAKLKKIVNETIQNNIDGREYVRSLESELLKAEVVAPGNVPPNVITMNTKVLLSMGDSEEEVEYTLVYPKEADYLNHKISILAPIGTAILGYKEGDMIEWSVPNGNEIIRVIKILYQPEFSGNFDL
jgi:regulator of nucleoside diphosphate kinase